MHKKPDKNLVHFFSYLKPGGGPSGYLYNLDSISKDLNGNSLFNIVYFKKGDERVSKGINDSRFSVLFHLPFFMRKVAIFFYYFFQVFSPVKAIRVFLKVKTYRAVVFHNFMDEMNFKFFFPLSRIKTGLMSHSPEMHYCEILSGLKSDQYKIYNFKLLEYFLFKIELYAFRWTDFFIFPTSHSYESYDKKFIDIIEAKNKYFIPSVIEKQSFEMVPDVGIGRIDASKKIIAFIGRYNEVKGFDVYLSLARKLSGKYNFISIGLGSLENDIPDEVINLGWRNDILSVLKKIDCVVIPNKKTYFDLLPLEALMMGSSLVLSYVGGNKYLVDMDRDFIKGFCDFEGLLDLFNDGFLEKLSHRKEVMEFFYENFDREKFAFNHNEIAKKYWR